MILNCIAIDHEHSALDIVTEHIRKTSFLRLIGSYTSAVDAIKDIREKDVNILFVAIKMPDISGIELAKILPKNIKVIFTTAFSQYAVDSYKVNTLDYILKPISYEDFLRASNKALEWFTEKNILSKPATDRALFIKSDYKLIKINMEDLLYVEGVKDYVKIVVAGRNEPIYSLMNMKKVEENLPKTDFMRSHRSYIVNINKIETIDKFRIVIGDTYIPISESYKDSFQRYFDSHTINI